MTNIEEVRTEPQQVTIETMTIEDVRTELQQVKNASNPCAVRFPLPDLARSLVQAAGRYATRLIQDGAAAHLLDRARIITKIIFKIEGCEVEEWTVGLPNSKPIRFRVPRPLLMWKDIVVILDQMRSQPVRRVPIDPRPLVGSYILLLCAGADSERKLSAVAKAIGKTAEGALDDHLVPMSRLMPWAQNVWIDSMVAEFIGWIVRGAKDLLAAWQQVKETGSAERVIRPRKASGSQNYFGFYDDLRKIPRKFDKKKPLEGTQARLSWAYFPHQDPKPHLLKQKAANGDCAVLRIGTQQTCQVFFPKGEFEERKANYDKGLEEYRKRQEEQKMKKEQQQTDTN